MKEIWKDKRLVSLKGEEWRDVVGYEGLYEISSLGRLRSIDRFIIYKNGNCVKTKGKVIAQRAPKNGYLLGNVCKNNISKKPLIHRLVAVAFIPNPKGLPEVNHKGGIITDNRASKLEWCTASDNQYHSHRILGNKSVCVKWGDNPRSKPVLKISMDGNILEKYGSSGEASIKNNIERSLIARTCRKEQKTSGGFKWKFA